MTGRGEGRVQWTSEGQGMLFDPILEQPALISASRAGLERLAMVQDSLAKIGAGAVILAKSVEPPPVIVKPLLPLEV